MDEVVDDALIFTVTDLKQYAYCPRVVFFEQCLPHVRPRTYKMDSGREAHEVEQKRAVRRTLTRFGDTAQERRFDVSLRDATLGLSGMIDEIIVDQRGGLIVIDYKLAHKASKNHRLQLAAYALLAEAQLKRQVTQGYIYLIPERQWSAVTLSKALRQQVVIDLGALRHMVEREEMPPPIAHLARCVACEFRRFCNDIQRPT